mmetsp:Transcript_13192/g.19922  ORF Transcript_13192/g.19922 Transcript_13192/m.19922 type:complete len:359 (+) Transcript_13192:108-1184(+)
MEELPTRQSLLDVVMGRYNNTNEKKLNSRILYVMQKTKEGSSSSDDSKHSAVRSFHSSLFDSLNHKVSQFPFGLLFESSDAALHILEGKTDCVLDFLRLLSSKLKDDSSVPISSVKILNYTDDIGPVIFPRWSSSLVSSFSLRSSSFCSPLTSFDWSFDNPLHIATSSIDSTVTVWDISKPKHPLHYVLAHPKKEVFDVSFVSSSVFASCSADGSVRCFDMRDLSTSDILYESSRPLLRLAWNRIEPDYFAVFEFDSDAITVLDRRFTSSPVAILSSAHSKPVNSFSWAPHSSFHMATASDDSSVFIWPLNQRLDDPSRYKPLSSFSAPAPIHSLSWSRLHFHWMALSFGSHLQLVRV